MVSSSCLLYTSTEADELTYCLHIMVRYEIEKQLIGGTLAVKDVPAEWKRLYKKYLGVDVPSDREGCLQDSHWSGGSIGYFPSYALGSAYGAQMLHKMQEEIGDIWPDVAKGDLSKVTDWLRSHIHRYASFKKPGELFESVCGKFDAKYYTCLLYTSNLGHDGFGVRIGEGTVVRPQLQREGHALLALGNAGAAVDVEQLHIP